ncbi:MAG: Rib/alpha-like domain-containing protein, partial [Microbacteriaceae bacterium]|nr:Rib/alpha-like domain-containing protein [Microbacteriaceae bacterium]
MSVNETTGAGLKRRIGKLIGAGVTALSLAIGGLVVAPATTPANAYEHENNIGFKDFGYSQAAADQASASILSAYSTRELGLQPDGRVRVNLVYVFNMFPVAGENGVDYPTARVWIPRGVKIVGKIKRHTMDGNINLVNRTNNGFADNYGQPGQFDGDAAVAELKASPAGDPQNTYAIFSHSQWKNGQEFDLDVNDSTSTLKPGSWQNEAARRWWRPTTHDHYKTREVPFTFGGKVAERNTTNAYQQLQQFLTDDRMAGALVDNYDFPAFNSKKRMRLSFTVELEPGTNFDNLFWAGSLSHADHGNITRAVTFGKYDSNDNGITDLDEKKIPGGGANAPTKPNGKLFQLKDLSAEIKAGAQSAAKVQAEVKPNTIPLDLSPLFHFGTKKPDTFDEYELPKGAKLDDPNQQRPWEQVLRFDGGTPDDKSDDVVYTLNRHKSPNPEDGPAGQIKITAGEKATNQPNAKNIPDVPVTVVRLDHKINPQNKVMHTPEGEFLVKTTIREHHDPVYGEKKTFTKGTGGTVEAPKFDNLGTADSEKAVLAAGMDVASFAFANPQDAQAKGLTIDAQTGAITVPNTMEKGDYSIPVTVTYKDFAGQKAPAPRTANALFEVVEETPKPAFGNGDLPKVTGVSG